MDSATLSASSDRLIEQLLSAKLDEGKIAIGVTRQNGIITVDLTWDEYNTDQILSLRYHRDGHFDLFYGYYDDDRAGYVSIVHDLSDDQIRALPVGLSPVMAQAFVTENPMSVSKNQLTSPK